MIRVQDHGGLRVLVLDRPDKANALTKAMLEALDAAVVAAQTAAEGVQVLVVTGVGSVLSAGADLDEAAAGLAVDPVWDRLSGRIAAFPGLTIAALNGALAGGAVGMALACDLRIAVPSAVIFYPVMKRGYLPQPADPARLAALIGPGRARMVLLAGVKVTADEALAWGLVDRVVDPAGLIDAARTLAADALAARPGHLAAIKAMIPGVG